MEKFNVVRYENIKRVPLIYQTFSSSVQHGGNSSTDRFEAPRVRPAPILRQHVPGGRLQARLPP